SPPKAFCHRERRRGICRASLSGGQARGANATSRSEWRGPALLATKGFLPPPLLGLGLILGRGVHLIVLQRPDRRGGGARRRGRAAGRGVDFVRHAETVVGGIGRSLFAR